MSKIVDLDQRKRNIEIDEQLESIGLDRDMISQYDAGSLKDVSAEFLVEFFKEREDVGYKFSEWVSENFNNTKELSLMASVLCEHFQHLLIPDLEELGMDDIVMGRKSEDEIVRMMKDLDNLIVLTSYLENFHMANMKEYLIESLQERKKG